MRGFIAGNTPLLFPPGTTMEHSSPTWAMYTNPLLNVTWLGYAVRGGTQIIKLPGARTKISLDFGAISKFVTQKQATACGQCGD